MLKLYRPFFSHLFFYIIICFIFFSIYFLNKNITPPPLSIPKQESSININETAIRLLSMGNKRLISSLLWVQTLLESDLDHYKNKDLNSWMYLRFRTIIATDPNFYEAYYYGGQYLSVIKDDDLGAADIFDRGLLVYPDDLWLNYFSGFHSYFELGDNLKAYNAYAKIQHNPKMRQFLPYIDSLMARLKAEEGDLEDAYNILSTAYEKMAKGYIKEKYAKSLYAIKAQIDLECLNSHQEKRCELTDWEGRTYIKNQNDTYIARKDWQLFRINKKDRSKK